MITIWKVYWQDQEQFALEFFRPLFNFRHPVGRSFNTILGHINETSCIWYRLKCPSARARQLNACARLLEKLARSFTIKAVTKFVSDPSSTYGCLKKLPFLLHSGISNLNRIGQNDLQTFYQWKVQETILFFYLYFNWYYVTALDPIRI